MDKVQLLCELEMANKRIDAIKDRFGYVLAAWMLSADDFKQEQVQRSLDKLQHVIYGNLDEPVSHPIKPQAEK